MINIPTIFNRGVHQIDELCTNMRNQCEKSQQSRYALSVLQIITNTFEASKYDLRSIASITFKDIANSCEKLESLHTLVFKPESPFSSPSKMRVNQETVAHQKQVVEGIVKAQQAVIGSWFARLNLHLASMLQNLRQLVDEKSKENQQIFEGYTSQAAEAEDLLNACNRIVANLEAVKKIVVQTSAQASAIQKSLTPENIDMRLASRGDLDKFSRLIQEIHTEYYKISEGLTYYSEQSDPAAQALYYRSDIKDKIDLAAIEEDDEGNSRNPFDVLSDYQRMIKGCLADLQRVLEAEQPSLIKVVRAYKELENYMEAKNNFVEDEMDICDEVTKELQEKLRQVQAHYRELAQSGTATKKKLDECRKKLIHREEKCIDHTEYVREIEKAAEKEGYVEAEHLLNKVRAMPEYYPYLTMPTFDFLLKVPNDHWLLAPLEFSSIAELEQAVAGFRRYDDAIRSFRLCMRGFGRTKAAIKPFILLESAILGEPNQD